jgi:hypothetical protein
MNKKTITLHVASWNNYWDKFGDAWCNNVNSFNTQPDEIVIVSDVPVDFSNLKNTNVKNIVHPKPLLYKVLPVYRNVAIDNSVCDWFVASDLDDTQFPNYLDNLDPESDISGFSFVESSTGKLFKPDSESLNDRLLGISDSSIIPGTSAIKRDVFNKIRYSNNCYEDMVFYATASKLNLKVTNSNPDQPRFKYSGFHPEKNTQEVSRVSKVYSKVLQSNRNLYCFWFNGRLTENRKKSLEVLRESCGVNLILINIESFYEYQNKEIPIHDGFIHLSDVHKSDYARAYMMYFYGEGYTDIKANSFDWNTYFDQLFLSKYDLIGYKNNTPDDIGNFYNDNINIKNDVFKNYNKFLGMGHFIFKPKTIIAHQWLSLIHKKMDEKFNELIANPATHPYSINGGIHSGYKEYVDDSIINKRYPFKWTEIGGTALHQVYYELNMQEVLLTMPMSNIINYR